MNGESVNMNSGSYYVVMEIKRCQSGLKVLVQHRYPGQSRNQGVAHGPISTIESHGT